MYKVSGGFVNLWSSLTCSGRLSQSRGSVQDTWGLLHQPLLFKGSQTAGTSLSLSHTGTGLSLLVPMKKNCNVIAYSGTIYNCVHPTLGQHILEEPHMSLMVMLRCPLTFDHKVISLYFIFHYFFLFVFCNDISWVRTGLSVIWYRT